MVVGDNAGNVTTTINGKYSLDGLQMVMEGFGIAPIVGDAVDGLNTLLYLAQGDFENAGYTAFAMIPLVGGAKPTISAIKKALAEVHDIVGGSLPKWKPGKWGSPQRGSSLKGYRLDPPHPTHPGSKYQFNYWDWTKGKKNSGGIWGEIEIK